MKVLLLLMIGTAFVASVSGGHLLAKFMYRYQKFADMQATEVCVGKEAYKKYMKDAAKAYGNCGNSEHHHHGLVGNPDQLISALLDGIENESFESKDGSTSIHIHGDFYNRGSVGQNVEAADALVNSLLSKLGLKDGHYHDHVHKHESGVVHSHPHQIGHHHGPEENEEAEPENDREGRQLKDEKSELDVLSQGLKERILGGKHHLESKVGNFTCVMQEFGYADDKMDLAMEGIRKSLDSYKDLVDPYFHAQAVKTAELCHDEAQALPESVLNECSFGPKFAKLKHFAVCKELRFKKNCMLLDAKKKLEEYFGSFEKIVQESEMKEEHLLMLVQKLLYGNQRY